MADASALAQIKERHAYDEKSGCYADFRTADIVYAACHTDRATLIAMVEAAQQWVADLQSGMYVNCVYCGHRYGPNETTPVTMADVLKEHIEQCPSHPLSEANAELALMTVNFEAQLKRNYELSGEIKDAASALEAMRVARDKSSENAGTWAAECGEQRKRAEQAEAEMERLTRELERVRGS